MGQKVHPHGMRVGVIKDWDSRWYARPDKVGDLIVEDHKIRTYLKKTLYSAGVPTIEIERDSAKVRIYIHCSRPGVVIGKGGAEIERLRLEVEKMIGKPVALSIVEVRTPDTNAQLVAENIAQQIEKRISHRRAMKNAIGRAMRMGALGIKVWIYKGEVLTTTLRSTPRVMDMNKRDDRRRDDRRGGRRDDRRGGDRRQGGFNGNRDNRGQGGYNRDNRGQGGYNRDNRGQGGQGFNRGPRPAAPAAPKEGGNA